MARGSSDSRSSSYSSGSRISSTSSFSSSSSLYTIVRGIDATAADIEGVIALDRLCLEARYQVTAAQDAAHFRINRECCFIVKEAESVVAYLMVLPVREETYALIRSGRFNDSALTPEMIEPFDHPGEYRLYFASVVVHPAHRNAVLVRLLLDKMFADFAELAARGLWVKSVTTDEISPLGVKMGHLLGLSKISKTDRGSDIYEVSCIPPEFRLVTPAARRFADIVRAAEMEQIGRRP